MFLYKYRFHPFRPETLRGDSKKKQLFIRALKHLPTENINIPDIARTFNFYRCDGPTGVTEIDITVDPHMRKLLSLYLEYRARNFWWYVQNDTPDTFLDLPYRE
jgi:hypothetical protein